MSRSQPSVEARDYERHADWLRSLARSMVSDASTADDIAQETWLSALRHGPSQDEPLRPWLRRVAQNAVRKFYRTEGRRRDREQLNAKVEEPLMSAAELSESADLIHTLMGEVRGLSEPYRSTVLQAYLQGMTSAEIAQQTGIAEGTVRWRLSAARDELRERMDRKVGSREGWAVLALPMGFTTRLAAAKAATTTVARDGLSFGWVMPATLVASCLGVLLVLVNLPESDPVLEAPLRRAEVVGELVPVAVAAPTVKQDRSAVATEALSGVSVSTAAAVSLPEPTLDPGQALLRVRVEGPTGEPINRVELNWKDHWDVRSSTNVDGLASLIFRPPATSGGVEFLLRRRGFVPQVHVLRVAAGRTTDIGTIRMETSLRRSGQVLLADGSRPPERTMVFAAPVGLEGASGPSAKRARMAPSMWPGVYMEPVEIDGGGAFALRDLPCEPMRLWADCDGMWFSASDVVKPEDEGEVEIVLVPLPTEEAIAGTVLDLDGEPTADVLVRLRPRGRAGKTLTSVTDAEGRFRFQPRGLEPYELLGEDLLDRFADTEWRPVSLGDASVALRFQGPLR